MVCANYVWALYLVDFGVVMLYHGGYMSIEEKKKLQVMLKRIQGQVGGIERMVSEDKDCEAVVTQIAASTSSLKSVAKSLLAEAVGSCSKEEYTKLLKRFL